MVVFAHVLFAAGLIAGLWMASYKLIAKFFPATLQVEWIEGKTLRTCMQVWLLLIAPVTLTLFALDMAEPVVMRHIYGGLFTARRHIFPT